MAAETSIEVWWEDDDQESFWGVHICDDSGYAIYCVSMHDTIQEALVAGSKLAQERGLEFRAYNRMGQVVGMNLYLLSQTVNDNWDIYDAVVVAAPDEETARTVHPSWGNNFDEEFCWDWVARLEGVSVKYIGTAAPDIKLGVVLASFNAG